MLYKKIIKKLTTAEAKRIKVILERAKFLQNLEDSKIFLEDFVGRENTLVPTGAFFSEIFSQEIGPCAIPANQLERSIGSCSMVNNPLTTYQRVDFKIALNLVPSSPESNFVFLGSRYTKLPNEYIYNNYLTETKKPGKIFTTALAFYNKKELYEKIFSALQPAKWNLARLLGSALTEDIFALFSAENMENKVKAFAFKSAKEQCTVRSQEETQLLNNSAIIGSALIKYKFENSPTEVSMLPYLAPDNSLVIYLTLTSNNLRFDLTRLPQEQLPLFMEEEKFAKFIVKKTEAWLKNLDSMTAFGMNIYKKFATKILVILP